ncbi:hypothetical protein PINS_up016076 [Pythium insidiosum]|nr:hypothetical protein PINS_up016076 [Pythium insidiosum]
MQGQEDAEKSARQERKAAAKAARLEPTGSSAVDPPAVSVLSSSSSRPTSRPSSPGSSPIRSRSSRRLVVDSPTEEEAGEVDDDGGVGNGSEDGSVVSSREEGASQGSDEGCEVGEAAPPADEDVSMGESEQGDASEEEDVALPVAKVTSKRGPRLLKTRLATPTPSGKAGFREFQDDFTEFLKSDRKERLSCEEPGAWPYADANQLELDRILSRLREMSWMLDLYSDERLTPTLKEYDQIAADADAVLPSMDEVLELYKTEPWKVLAVPPEPVSFSKKDPRFAKFYSNTVALYSHHAQALWERTHYFTPDEVDEDDSKKKKESSITRSRFFSARRRRNGKLTPHWNAHLAVIQGLLADGLSVDALLDPFFYWPPAYGVLCVPVSEGESVADCCRRLDEFEPSRLFFRGRSGADIEHHPVAGLDREVGFTVKLGKTSSSTTSKQSPAKKLAAVTNKRAASAGTPHKPHDGSGSKDKASTSSSRSLETSSKAPSKASLSTSMSSNKKTPSSTSKSLAKQPSASSSTSSKKRPASELKTSTPKKALEQKRSRRGD